MSDLSPHHRNMLKASGLTDETIDKARIFTVADHETFRTIAKLPPTAGVDVPAMAFEYPEAPGYVRLRPDQPLIENDEYTPEPHGWSPHFGKEPQYVPGGPKYRSPVGSETRLYIRRDICPGIDDESQPLWLLEGEKKTLAAIQSGLVAIGAPGVTCFGDAAERLRAKASGTDALQLHRDLRNVPLYGREVVICFDSDIDEEPQVLAAAFRLGVMLEQASAITRIAYIDPLKKGEKLGLDDYLAALPPEKRLGKHPLDDIEESVRPFNVADCLDEFIEREWESWSDSEQDRELGRLVRLACHAFRLDRDIKKFMKKCARALDVPLHRVERFVVNVKDEKSSDPRVWLGEWMWQNNVTFELRSGTERFTMNGQVVEQETLLRRMALDAATYGGPTRQNIEDALFVWKMTNREAVLGQLRKRLAHHPELSDTQARAFVRALTGREDPVDVAVLRHFIWQAKRKVYDMEVTDHLMLLVHGAQRVGKSVAIRKLLGPVEQFKDEPGDVTVVADERQAFRFAWAFVVFLDEMPKCSKTDMDAFKNRISQPDVTWRVLGSHLRETRPNRSTFIGASNNTLQDLINDDTGVRRFYQLECADKVDWGQVNAIDYDALWASVDERGPAPINEVRPELERRQEELRVRSPVEEFVVACCERREEWTSARELYNSFKDFMKDQNYPAAYWSMTRFGRKLVAVIGSDRKKVSDGPKYQLTLVNLAHGSLLDQADRVVAQVAEAKQKAAANQSTIETKRSA